MGKIILIIIGIIVLAGIAWVGLSVWSATCGGPDTNPHDMPDKAEATHSFSWASGGMVLSSDYETHGEAGSRKFILHGYWELRGQKFKYLSSDIILDEAIFGKITVKRR